MEQFLYLGHITTLDNLIKILNSDYLYPLTPYRLISGFYKTT